MNADAGASAFLPPRGVRGSLVRRDPPWVRLVLIGLALVIMAVLVVVPVVLVFVNAFSAGAATYVRNLFGDPDTRHSILLTLTVVPIALAANVAFGIAAAWVIARFRFPGRGLMLAAIDLPFAVSPVVAGLMLVLIFGLQGYLGPFLRESGYAVLPYFLAGLGALVAAVVLAVMRPLSRGSRTIRPRDLAIALAGAGAVFALLLVLQQQLHLWPRDRSLKIIFATPGLVLATAFVTFPFVARELIPLLEAIGPEEELAAVSLGANGWQMFRQVTLPNIKWGLAYGIILCNARAMGEFGAVSVVSGHIAGQTETMPLRIEKLFQEYNLPGSFALASLLTLLALVTLLIKAALERAEAASRSEGSA